MNPSNPPNFPLPLRFAFSGEPEKLLQEQFLRDAAMARLSWKFRCFYQFRPYIPVSARRFLQRKRNRSFEVADDWYLFPEFWQAWEKAFSTEVDHNNSLMIHPWPDSYQSCFTLTHDVEGPAGVGRVDQIASIEEKLGFRSCWNFVPYNYPFDRGLLRDLQARGHEIGVHGYNHDGRLFSSRRLFRSRLPKINQAAKEFSADGFRAPMVHRNLVWLQDLSIRYDASCFDFDPFQAMPGGVGGIWPFIVGSLVELPYTLPQDHTLLALGQPLLEVWMRKLRLIRTWSGMALMLTHPDYLDSSETIDAYTSFLKHMNEQTGSWRALPRDICRWWIERDQSRVTQLSEREHTAPLTEGSVVGPASSRGRSCNLSSLKIV